ncbi:MAG: DDE-type integrase/transposase/recombinase [bacterium]|nr:DDE-type integrase/transposase/recombinase [bacterium]
MDGRRSRSRGLHDLGGGGGGGSGGGSPAGSDEEGGGEADPTVSRLIVALEAMAAGRASAREKTVGLTKELPFRGEEGAAARAWTREVDAFKRGYGWSDEVAGRWAAMQLRGPAGAWFALRSSELANWADLRAAVLREFAPATTQETVVELLCNRRQRAGETHWAYWRELTQLAQRADPPLDSATVYSLFRRGLHSHLLEKLKVSRAASWSEAMALLDSLAVPSLPEGETVHAVAASPAPEAGGRDSLQRQLQQLTEAVAALAAERGGGGPNRRARNTPRFRFTDDGRPICNRCGGEGHVRRECPRRDGGGTLHHRGRTADTAPRGAPGGDWRAAARHRPIRTAQPTREPDDSDSEGSVVHLDDTAHPVRAVGADGRSLYTWARVPGGRCKALLDTGATVSLLARARSPAKPKPYFGPPLRGPDGTELEVSGTVKMEIEVGRYRATHRFVVVPVLTEDMLLGLDFLRKHVRTLDPRSGEIAWRRGGAPSACAPAGSGRLSGAPKVVAAAPVTVRPHTISAVHVRSAGPHPGATMVRVQPTRRVSTRTPLIFPDGPINAIDGDGRLWLVNDSDHPVVVAADTVLAVQEGVGEKQAEGAAAAAGVEEEVAAALADESDPRTYLDAHVGEALGAEGARAMRTLLEEFADVFAPATGVVPVTTQVQHRIVTEGPPVAARARRLSPDQTRVVAENVQAMRLAGVIRPSSSPWAAPVVIVRKKDGSVRFCVDYRALNRQTKNDTYPLPRVDDTLQALRGSTIFTTMDLAKGYWQIAIHGPDKEKTAFVTPSGLWEFNVMPFGLRTAPATFQRFMDSLVRDLPGDHVLVYMDDVVVHSATVDDHLRHVRQVLEMLRRAGVAAKASKCEFGVRQADFLGHRITAQGYAPLMDRTAALRDYPAPTDVRQLRRFLGMAGYYRSFVPHYSTLAEPLTRLTKKTVAWTWGEAEQGAMDAITERLAKATRLAYPDTSQPFTIYTDASDVGAGAIVSQRNSAGVERPLAFISQTFAPAQRRYSATERECLAVLLACRAVRHWILGRPTDLFTDHAALKWLLATGKETTTARLARWVTELQEYSLRVHHRPGSLMEHADALSRVPSSTTATVALAHVGPDWADLHHTDRPPARLAEPTGVVLCPPASVAAVGLGGLGAPDDEDTDLRRLVRQPLPRAGGGSAEGATRVDDWAADLAADPFTRDVIDYIRGVASGGRPRRPQGMSTGEVDRFSWDGKLLRWQPKAGGGAVVVVPRSRVQQVLQEAHAGRGSCHPGARRTEARVQAAYYWPAWRSDVREYVAACTACQATGPAPDGREGPMGSLRSMGPWDLTAMDMVGPLTPTPDGYRWALVFIDHFTRYVVAGPIREATAKVAARFFVEGVVTRFGAPRRLLTDRGTNFTGQLFMEVARRCGVRRSVTTAYHPQGDGRAERVIGTLTRQLRRMVAAADGGADWAELLPWVVAAYNSTPHRATGEQPHFLLFGRDMRLPTAAAALEGPGEVEPRSPDHAAAIRRAVARVHRHLADAAAREQGARQAGRRQGRMQAGSQVWLYSPRGPRASKLQAKWVGPLRVIAAPSPQVRVLESSPGEAPVKVSVGRLKPYVAWEPRPQVAPLDTRPVGDEAAEAQLRQAAEEAHSAALVPAVDAGP